jgi:hypothetical protein
MAVEGIVHGVICLDGLRKIMENVSQCNRSACQDFNPGPLKYKSGQLAVTFGNNSITFVIL